MALVRVVFDTNVIVSGIAYPASIPGLLLAQWRNGHLDLVTSRHIVDEVARVLPRLTSAGITADQAREIADHFLFCHFVEPTELDVPDLRDPADLPILGTLIAGEAQFLVTGDADLLALANRFPILTPRAFHDRYAE
ncbi:MAG: putative toxin-antitoxin system toxin component, PIN family [Micrococcales bacterium]|nr:putative toxin-antitoxin system toxin component, PIN family [Micrococcales bacterium]